MRATAGGRQRREGGLAGSRRYVEARLDEGGKLLGAFNLDMVGSDSLGNNLQVVHNTASRWLMLRDLAFRTLLDSRSCFHISSLLAYCSLGHLQAATLSTTCYFLTLTSILRGRALGAFGIVSVSTPSCSVASTLSTSTSTGRSTLLQKDPVPRSRRWYLTPS